MGTDYSPDEQWSFARAVDAIVDFALDEGLPFPRGLRDNIPGDQLLVLDFGDEQQAQSWAPFFKANNDYGSNLSPRQPFYTRSLAWHGWTVALWFDKSPVVAE